MPTWIISDLLDGWIYGCSSTQSKKKTEQLMTRKKFIPPRSLSGSATAVESTVASSTTASTLSSGCGTIACSPVSVSGVGVDSRLVARERLLQVQSTISKVSGMRGACARMLVSLERTRLGLLRKEVSGLFEDVGVDKGSVQWSVSASGCGGVSSGSPKVPLCVEAVPSVTVKPVVVGSGTVCGPVIVNGGDMSEGGPVVSGELEVLSAYVDCLLDGGSVQILY